MRKIWSRHHIRYFACAMAVIIGLLPPCAALAAEEETSKEETAAEETSEEEAAKEDSDSEEESDITYITAFEPLAEEDAILSCMEKPAPDELMELFPETLVVWIEGEEESAELEVDWESSEDFEETKLERYTFSPKWDETLYAIAESAEDTIEIPSIIVEVPVEKGMIPELEEAKNALQDIIEDKSILALVYLCDEYEVKGEPSAEAETIHTVVSGQSVQITDAELDEDGKVWYQTLFYQGGKEYTGYVERGYLAASDEDFMQWEETYIELPPAPRMMRSRRAVVSYPDVDQFPASYQNALYELKASHPNWIFVRMDTGIDWNTAISKEMGDKSLVHASSPGSWQNGVYGQGWCYASESILKYYMDPRNFLTDPSVFQFEQLTYNDSYHTAEAVQEVLKNSFMASVIPGDSQTYAQAFTAIGKETGVSPFHLASRVLQEQGTKGTSALISGTYSGYKGYYNYFNVGASGKTNVEVIINGLEKAKELGWNTRYKSLNGGAYVIGANYILKGQDTLYLEKFNVSNGYHKNFTHQYMQNIQAPNSEASNIRKAYNNAGALENSFVFKIPVYNNMPASACTKPGTTDTITLDKTTASLQVNQTVKLIPYINGSKVDYISNMTFSSDDTAVATVDSVGKVTAVSPGSVVISCTRSGVGTAVCTVTVGKADPDVSTPTLSPCTYREGLQLKDISLPDGWKWSNDNTKIEVGTHSFEALYTPEDTVKYNTVRRNISFTVTKAVPVCTMPEGVRVFTGLTLGEISLPKDFVWESDTEIELREPGEYTFYVSYRPDEENYYSVDHIPLIVQVIGEASKPDEGDDTGPGGGTSTSGDTPSGSGTTSSGSTGTGSGNGTSTGGGTTSSGSSTGTGSGSGTSTGGGTTSSGSSTGTGSGSGTSTGGDTPSGGGTTSSGSTGTGSGSGTSMGGDTPSGGGMTSGGSTNTGSGNGTSTGGGTTSSGSTNTGSGSSTGTGNGASSGGGVTSGAGSSGTGAPLKELPKNTESTKSKGDSAKSDKSQSKKEETQNGADSGSQQTQNEAGSSQPAQNETGGGSQIAQGGTGVSQPAQNGTDNSQSTQPASGVTQPAQSEGGGSSQQKQSGTADSQSAKNGTEKKSTEIQSQSKETESSQTQSQTSEESISKPAVKISMEDTTVLTPEKLQMAKDQNLDLVLEMGKYAVWNIDTDAVDMNTVSDVDMGIELGTENIPTKIIADLLDGNQYLEFTLAHDGPFGFHPLLRIAFDSIYEGWYANLFYYNEETEALEFICDAVIDSDGIATFDMEHASSYVIIVSPVSMAGMMVTDDAVTGDSGSHAMGWIAIGVIICMIAAGAGCGVFFWRKKMQEEEDDEEDEDDEDDEYEEIAEAAEDEYDEAGEEEYDENDEEVAGEEYEEVEEEAYEEVGEEAYEEAEKGEYEEAGEEEYEEYDEEYEHDDEDDWIEDEDWQEPETPQAAASDRFADDHAEDDWIDDDEWDIGNDWIEDAEWEKRKEA